MKKIPGEAVGVYTYDKEAFERARNEQLQTSRPGPSKSPLSISIFALPKRSPPASRPRGP